MEVGELISDVPPFKKGSIVWVSDSGENSLIKDFKKIGETYKVPSNLIKLLSNKEIIEKEKQFFIPILPPIQLFGGDK